MEPYESFRNLQYAVATILQYFIFKSAVLQFHKYDNHSPNTRCGSPQLNWNLQSAVQHQHWLQRRCCNSDNEVSRTSIGNFAVGVGSPYALAILRCWDAKLASVLHFLGDFPGLSWRRFNENLVICKYLLFLLISKSWDTDLLSFPGFSV